MARQRSGFDMVQPLKFWRAKRGFSQAKLARQGKLSALTIGQLESGRRKARGNTLEKILKAFAVSQDEFFGMREGAGAAPSFEPAPLPTLKYAEPKAAAPAKEGAALRLSNLDLELLNRILNLDFDGKVETLKYLQGMT